MYEFNHMNSGRVEDERLPSQALFINGVAIEDEISGYRTLTVSGRELMSAEVNAPRRSNGHGSLYLGKTFPPRFIRVEYELKSNNVHGFREKYNQLNKLLNQELMELRFNDEYAYSYTGNLSEVEEVPAGRNSVVGSFVLECPLPFKYLSENVVKGNQVTLSFDDTFDTLPNKIVVTPERSTSTITLQTGGKQVRLSQGSFSAGQRIVFDFYNEDIYSGSTNLLNKLDLASEFEHFFLKSGVPIQLVEVGTMDLHFNEVAL